MAKDIIPGRWVIYQDAVGIIAEVYNPNGVPVIEIHYVNPDGTTKEYLDETNPDHAVARTIVETITFEHWDEIEFLGHDDVRIPETRRRK